MSLRLFFLKKKKTPNISLASRSSHPADLNAVSTDNNFNFLEKELLHESVLKKTTNQLENNGSLKM